MGFTWNHAFALYKLNFGVHMPPVDPLVTGLRVAEPHHVGG